MAFPRRRSNSYYSRLRSLLPLVSVISAFLLLFFGLLSFLAPSPKDSIHPFSYSSRAANVGVVEDALAKPVFRVPRSGGKSDRDIWSSKDSKFFYGCSNASDKFPNENAVTVSNRYLLIATSGGLNQQRTGVNF